MLATTALSLLLLEVATRGAWRLLHHAAFRATEQQSKIKQVASGTLYPSSRNGEMAINGIIEVVHPYLGYVREPNAGHFVSEQGFPSYDPIPSLAANPDHLKVGVFGGSFAEMLTFRKETLAKEIEASAAFKKSPVDIINFSMGGYKQPQQLFALTYLLSMGVKLDVVVNIDGLNEIVLPVVDNIPQQTNPLFPRFWAQRVLDTNNPAAIKVLFKINRSKKIRQKWAALVSDLKMDHFVTGYLLWNTGDILLSKRIIQLQNLLMPGKQGVQNYLLSGPPFSYKNEDELYSSLGQSWMQSSLLMKALCDAQKIKYVHFLQPNQYVPGSKQMSAEELSVAVNPSHPYRSSVIKGYPYLQKFGQELRRKSVDFFDMTMVFKDNKDVLYGDTCCHLNVAGIDLFNSILAQKIEERANNN